MTPITFAEVAAAAAALGYRPFPGLQNTKMPAMKGWPGLNRARWDSRDLEDTVRDFEPGWRYCCCLAVQDDLVAYDFDISQPELAALAEEIADRILGQTPLIRIGRAPKSVRIYRNAGGICSSKLHPLETFCGSGQVVGFGWHLEANQPYRWLHESPISLPADSPDVPAVSRTQDAFFKRELFAVVPRQLRVAVLRPVGRPQTIGDRLRMLTIMKGSWRLAAAQVLSEATEGCRNDTGWSVVASAAARGISEDDVRRLFQRHFAGWDGFSEADLHDAIERARPAPLRSNMNFGGGPAEVGADATRYQRR